MADALVFFAQNLAQSGMSARDAQLLIREVNKYARWMRKGETVMPDPNTGNPRLNRLIIAIVEYIGGEDISMTMRRAGKKLEKRAGCARGRCGNNWYYYQPWWWNYWYYYFSPYYWWTWNGNNANFNTFNFSV